jgi:predicted NUDIX family NTP pyrophosphohydrolase
LLVYRFTDSQAGAADKGIEVLLVHPGGPFWAKKDDGAWSIPKGELDESERAQPDKERAAYACAIREFEEELGQPAPSADPIDLGEIRQRSGKVVRAWGLHSSPGDIDAASICSNDVELEWPRGSGRTITFPEVDRAEWVTPETARLKLVSGQMTLLDRLLDSIGESVAD